MTISELRLLAVNALDKLESIFFGSVATRQGYLRTENPHKSYRSPALFFERWLIGIAGLLLVGLILAGVHFYSNTGNLLAEKPGVVRLSTDGVSAKVRVGSSPTCDNQSDCWVLPNIPLDEGWRDVMLPKADLTTLPDFPRPGEHSWIYYRMDIPVSESIRQSEYSISFSPTYIWHETFFVYLDGKEAFRSRVPKDHISTINVPIPDEMRKKPTISIAIKGSVGDGELGLHHYGSFFIGPQHLLNDVYVINERANSTYFLLFSTATGSIFLLLSLFYFWVGGNRGLFSFLVFCFCTTTQSIVRGDFIQSLLSESMRVTLFHASRVIGIFALAIYLREYLRVQKFYKSLVVSGILVTIVVTVICILEGWFNGSVSTAKLFPFSHALLNAVIITASVIALLRIRRENNSLRSSERINETRVFACLLLTYLFLINWEVFFLKFGGFEKRAIFDLMFFLYMGYLSARRLGISERQVAEQRIQIQEMSLSSLAGSMTQMFAHDVRQPFSLFRMMTEKLAAATNATQIQTIVERYGPAAERSLEKVEAMAADLLHLGTQRSMICEPIPPTEILMQTLSDVFAIPGNRLVYFQFDFRHSHCFFAESGPIARCFQNILENARQATPASGKIWIMTEDVVKNNRTYVQTTIGNSGSYIPSDLQGTIFQPFVSKGKVSGTGLGLAVVKRVVQLHGGTVWCQSQKTLGTEFLILLPASDQIDPMHRQDFPMDSVAIIGKQDTTTADASRSSNVNELPNLQTVIVIDDDPFILEEWAEVMVDAKVRLYSDALSFWNDLALGEVVLDDVACFVCDYYLGENQPNGEELTKAIRDVYQGKIFMCSDRVGSKQSWLTAYISKMPMTLSALNHM